MARDHPEYFVRGDEADLEREPASFVRVGDVVVANGRDPYFPAWPDVVQLERLLARPPTRRDDDAPLSPPSATASAATWRCS